MKGYLRNLMILALLLAPACAWPAVPAPSNGSVNSEGAPAVVDQGPALPAPEMQFPVFRTLGGMGLVLCLMIAAFFAAKKFAPRYFKKTTSERNLKIIETLGMGDRRSISLVEIGRNRFLVGNTPHQISLLAALPESMSMVSEAETTALTAHSTSKQDGSNSFRSMFEFEKGRSSQSLANPLPEDLRSKMRQLRDALERS